MASRVMTLRYEGVCDSCGRELPARTRAYWDADAHVVTCMACYTSGKETLKDSNTVTAPTPEDEARQALTIPESGIAGSSALHQYRRLHDRRERNIDRRFGRFAGIVKLLVDDPQSITSWEKGSEGERVLAAALAARLGDRAIILNDRKVPRSRANIDHLVVAATGVWVVDAKRYRGKVERRDVGGWFRVDNRVYVGGRDRTSLTKGLHRQEVVVRQALGNLVVPVHKVLCFVDAEWGWFTDPFKIDGVLVTWGKKLAEIISAEGLIEREELIQIASQLAEALPAKEG